MSAPRAPPPPPIPPTGAPLTSVPRARTLGGPADMADPLDKQLVEAVSPRPRRTKPRARGGEAR